MCEMLTYLHVIDLMCFSILVPDTTTEEEERLCRMTNPNEITIEASYKGPRLSFPLTLTHVKTLIKAFKMKQVGSQYTRL